MKKNFENYLKNLEFSKVRDPSKLIITLVGLANGFVRISELVHQMPLKDLTKFKGTTNPQGEITQWLDAAANDVIKEIFLGKGECALIVSEEEEVSVPVGAEAGKGEYLLAIDPLDGSSNLGMNIPVGTIFSIWQRKDPHLVANDSEFFIDGHQIIAAGYTVYGPNTLFVLSVPGVVAEFVLNDDTSEFILISDGIKIPDVGKTYSINEGNSATWDLQTTRFVDYCKNGKEVPALSARYIGSLVSDFHRNLIKGGVFIYPSDKKNTNGKLRMLYECLPMSFVCENAGGRSSNGIQDVLTLIPKSIHQRCPLVIGSKDLVDRYDAFVTSHDQQNR